MDSRKQRVLVVVSLILGGIACLVIGFAAGAYTYSLNSSKVVNHNGVNREFPHAIFSNGKEWVRTGDASLGRKDHLSCIYTAGDPGVRLSMAYSDQAQILSVEKEVDGKNEWVRDGRSIGNLFNGERFVANFVNGECNYFEQFYKSGDVKLRNRYAKNGELVSVYEYWGNGEVKQSVSYFPDRLGSGYRADREGKRTHVLEKGSWQTVEARNRKLETEIRLRQDSL